MFFRTAHRQFVSAYDNGILAYAGNESQIDEITAVAAREIGAHFFFDAFERSVLF